MPRHLAIANETVFGTPVTPPTLFIDAKTIDIDPEREFARAPSMIYNGPAYIAPAQYKITGDIAVHPSSENIARMLMHMFTTPTSTQDGGNPRWKHVYTPSDTLKFGTYYKVPDVCAAVTSALQVTSMIPISCRVEARRGEPIVMTFGMFGVKDAKVTATALGAVSTVRPFFAMDGTLYWDLAQTDAIANIDSLTLTYARAIADDMYSMTDAFLQCFVPGEATITGEMDLLFSNWDAYGNFWAGVKSAAAPIAKPVPVAFSAKLLGDSLGGSGEYANHKMQWDLPSVILKSVKAPIELRNKILQTVGFEGYKGTVAGGSHCCAVTLANTIAGSAI